MNARVFPPDRSNLARLMAWWAGVVIILSALMAGIILRGTWAAASQAEQNAVVIQELYQLLNAANLLAAERAPSNILMATTGAGQAEARQRLSHARQRTDTALRQAAILLPGPQYSVLLQRLQYARQLVDQTTAAVKSDPTRLQDAINSMFAVSDVLHEIIMQKTAQWVQEDTSLSAPVLRAVALTELRDTAGRMGSWLIAPVRTQTPLSGYNREGLYRADERVNMLWGILAPTGASSSVSNGRLAAIRTEAKEHFFKEGRPLINKLISEGLSDSGSYSYSAVGLSQRYLSTLTLLERWQHEYLRHLIAQYNQRAERESDLFMMVLFTLLIITGLISVGAFVVQFRILRPLLIAQKIIVGLAEKHDVTIPLPPRIRELDQLFHSIEILKAQLAERDELTRRLQHLAETDELTGLYNRRAFDLAGKAWLSRRHPGGNIFLIILDLDHFKMINDRYGHPVGDSVLSSAADAIRRHVREEDIAARIGGEEFGVVIRRKEIAAALALAERIRTELHTLNVISLAGDRIKVTSSFGIAGAKKSTSWRQLIADADSALYEAKKSGRDCIHLNVPEATG